MSENLFWATILLIVNIWGAVIAIAFCIDGDCKQLLEEITKAISSPSAKQDKIKIPLLAADIARRIPELQADSPTNNCAVIENIIRQHAGGK